MTVDERFAESGDRMRTNKQLIFQNSLGRVLQTARQATRHDRSPIRGTDIQVNKTFGLYGAI